MRKLLSIAKFLAFCAAIYGAFYFVWLGEWVVHSNSLVKDCLERGLAIPPEELRLVVSCRETVMRVYAGDVLLKTYDISIGSGEPGTGVARHAATPVGEYKILTKTRRSEWLETSPRRLEFDYPNTDDLDTAMNSGLISAAEATAIIEGNRSLPVALGGPLVITGNYSVVRGTRATDGSIAMTNSDLVELYEIVVLGTPLVIKNSLRIARSIGRIVL